MPIEREIKIPVEELVSKILNHEKGEVFGAVTKFYDSRGIIQSVDASPESVPFSDNYRLYYKPAGKQAVIADLVREHQDPTLTFVDFVRRKDPELQPAYDLIESIISDLKTS